MPWTKLNQILYKASSEKQKFDKFPKHVQ